MSVLLMKLRVINIQLKPPPLAGLLQALQLEPNFWFKAAITQAHPYKRRSNKSVSGVCFRFAQETTFFSVSLKNYSSPLNSNVDKSTYVDEMCF